jgi:hypothetical protein
MIRDYGISYFYPGIKLQSIIRVNASGWGCMRNFNWLLLAVRLLGVRSARYSPQIPPLSRISRTVVLLYNLFRLGIPLAEPSRARSSLGPHVPGGGDDLWCPLTMLQNAAGIRMGLSNLHALLQLLCNAQYSFTITSSFNKYLIVPMRVPVSTPQFIPCPYIPELLEVAFLGIGARGGPKRLQGLPCQVFCTCIYARSNGAWAGGAF